MPDTSAPITSLTDAEEWLARFEAHMKASTDFTAALGKPEKRGLDKVRDAIKAVDGRYNDGPNRPIHWESGAQG